MELKQVVKIEAGYPFRGRIPEIQDGDACVIQMKDVSVDGDVNWNDCFETKLEGKRQPGWLTEGDVLFAARGSRNYAALVDGRVNQMHVVAAPHFYILKCDSPNILPEYLTWFINQAPSQRYFQREAEGSVTKSIRRSVLEALPIALPSLDKQQSIIKLANTVKNENKLMQQLINSGETLMNAIANDLLNDTKLNGAIK